MAVVVSRGDKMLTLNAREELYRTRIVTSCVLGTLWELDRLLSINQAHHKIM